MILQDGMIDRKTALQALKRLAEFISDETNGKEEPLWDSLASLRGVSDGIR